MRLPLRRRFPLVLLPYFTLNDLLSADAQRRALAGVAARLTPDGRAFVDVFVPHARLAHCPREPILRRDTLHADGRRIRAWVAYALDPATQIERRHHVFESSGREAGVERREFWTERRWITHGEMRKLVGDAGLVVERSTTGYADAPVRPDAEQVLYAVRRAS
jgi:hypothetical protein